MSNYDIEQRAMDVMTRAEQKGEWMQVLGWSLLFMSGISCVFIWVGWRSGSSFWFWWTGGLAFLGLACVAAGIRSRAYGAKEFASVGDNMRSGLAPSLKAEELPPREQIERHAA